MQAMFMECLQLVQATGNIIYLLLIIIPTPIFFLWTNLDITDEVKQASSWGGSARPGRAFLKLFSFISHAMIKAFQCNVAGGIHVRIHGFFDVRVVEPLASFLDGTFRLGWSPADSFRGVKVPRRAADLSRVSQVFLVFSCDHLGGVLRGVGGIHAGKQAPVPRA